MLCRVQEPHEISRAERERESQEGSRRRERKGRVPVLAEGKSQLGLKMWGGSALFQPIRGSCSGWHGRKYWGTGGG